MKGTKRHVAPRAEERSDFTCGVVMVDTQPFFAWLALAECAESHLHFDHSEISRRQQIVEFRGVVSVPSTLAIVFDELRFMSEIVGVPHRRKFWRPSIAIAAEPLRIMSPIGMLALVDALVTSNAPAAMM